MAKEEPGLSGLCHPGKAINPDSIRGHNTTMDDRIGAKRTGTVMMDRRELANKIRALEG